jgi:hypothetical protein
MTSREGIHYAKLESSERLQRVLRLLSDGRWHSTRDIMFGADVCAVSTTMAELRENGIRIITICRSNPRRYEYALDSVSARMSLEAAA